MHNITMNGSISIDKIINDIEPEKRYCHNDKLDKAQRLTNAAAKMMADAARLLDSYASYTTNPKIRMYAKLACDVASESATLAAAVSAICDECVE